jgi:hypothetical protein
MNGRLTMKRVLITTITVSLLVGVAGVPGAKAESVPGVCRLSRLWQTAFAPVNLPPFQTIVNGEEIVVGIDPDTGEFVFDMSGIPELAFPNGFSDALDVITFPTAPATGTIDAGGNIFVPELEFRVCTFGTCPGGGGACTCVPGNVCSNDTSRLCIAAVSSGELACEAGGVCQGVCSDDLTKTCAADDDCLPAGFCGQGNLLRLNVDLTSGTDSLGEFQLVGNAATTFTDGKITLIDVFGTNPETPVIGDTGITSMTLDCTLDPVPSQGSLPPPPSWSVTRGIVRLGKEGPSGADDKLKLKGGFLPLGGVADFASTSLVFSLGADDATVAALTIPAGSLSANKKGNKFKLKDKGGTIVQVNPPLPAGAAPNHKITLKRGNDGVHKVLISSKGLRLDGLNAAAVDSGVAFGSQTPGTTSPVSANKKGNKLKF